MGHGETRRQPADDRPIDERLLFDRLVGALSPELRQALKAPLRRQILRILNEREAPMTPRELVAAVGSEGLSQVCFHLAMLEQAGSVMRRDQGSVRTFSSTVAENPQVVAVLRAVAKSDRGHE